MKLLGLTKNKDILFVQAFLLLKKRGINIDSISYIRVDNIEGELPFIKWWEGQNVRIDIKPLQSCGMIYSEEDNIFLENEIYNWYINQIDTAGPIFLFTAGGHTISNLIMQRCGFLFGAEDVFHMLVNIERGKEPTTIEAVMDGISMGKILYISLGTEAGWPIFKNLDLPPDISSFVRQVSTNITNRRIEDINEFPFECINLLPQQTIQWLQSSLTEDDKNFVLDLPKIELHCHLGGFAVGGEILDQVRAAADESFELGPIKDIKFPDAWPMPSQAIGLNPYRNLGDNSGSYILKNKGCLVAQIKSLYEHLLNQNIRYAEIRCSPYNYTTDIMDVREVLKTITDTFDGLMLQYSIDGKIMCHVNLLLIGTRNTPGDNRSIDNHIDLAIQHETNSDELGKCRIVGLDLAGFEDVTTRASYYITQFDKAHRKGIALTVHAGENDEAEGIWQAVFKLNTRRIGHGLNLKEDPQLIRSVANRKIGVEMCPFANYQIIGFHPMKDNIIRYPLLDYLNAGIQVTVNTDNIGISDASLSDNFMLLTKLTPGITRMNILQIIRNGIEQAFIDVNVKDSLIKRFNREIFKRLNAV